MNVNQYQKYHKNTRNMKKGILASNIGALPILQECPTSWNGEASQDSVPPSCQVRQGGPEKVEDFVVVKCNLRLLDHGLE